MNIGQYAIQIGPLTIHYYALLIITGIFIASVISASRAKARGLDPEIIWDGLIWVIVPAVIGARIYHILTPTPAETAPDGSALTTLYYLQHPLDMLSIWNGGLGIYGGVVGGLLGAWLYMRHKQQPLLKWLDIVAPTILIGQAIGRWGNFINQELYGAPTTLPWGIYIPPNKRLPGYGQYDYFHPLFLYESIMSVIAFGLSLLIERRYRERLRDGDMALIYLICYPIERFLLDFVRLDSNGFGPLTTAQVVSLVTIIIASALLILRHRKQVEVMPSAASQ